MFDTKLPTFRLRLDFISIQLMRMAFYFSWYSCPHIIGYLTASNIDRYIRKLDGDSHNNYTIAHHLNNNSNSNSNRDIINNVINVGADDIRNYDPHFLPVVASNEPNQNSKYLVHTWQIHDYDTSNGSRT